MIMKTLIRTFILFFCITGLASCYAGIPLKSGKSENNQTYEVSYLFEHDGVKVYRFLDLGNYVYFTTRGDVTSIKNDSTRKRTITIIKTVYQTDNEKRLSNKFLFNGFTSIKQTLTDYVR